jgi:hypothetical protein
MSNGNSIFGGWRPGTFPPHDVVLYGCPPVDPLKPLQPEDWAKLLPIPALQPCAKCKRHIMRGTECAFCYAKSLQPVSKPSKGPLNNPAAKVSGKRPNQKSST